MSVLLIEYTLLTLSALSMIWAGIILIRRGLSRPYEYALLIFLTGVFGWSCMLLLTLLTGHWTFAQGAFMSAPIGLMGLTAFALMFPSNTLTHKHVIFFIPTLLAILLASTPHLLVRNLHIHATGHLSIERDVQHVIFSILISLGGILPTLILLHRFKRSFNPLLRQKFFWFLSVMTCTIVASIITNVILPNFFDFPKLNSAGPLFSTSLAGSIVFLVLQEYYISIRHILLSLLLHAIPWITSIPLCIVGLAFFYKRTDDMLSAIIIAGCIYVLSVYLGNKAIRVIHTIRTRTTSPHTDQPLPNEILQQLMLASSYIDIEHMIIRIAHDYIGLAHVRLFTAARCPTNVGNAIAELSVARMKSSTNPPAYTQETVLYGIPETEYEHKTCAQQAMNTIDTDILIPIICKNHMIGVLTGKLKNKSRTCTQKNDIRFLTDLAHTISPLLLRVGCIEQLQQEKSKLSSTLSRIQQMQREEKDERKTQTSLYIARFREYLISLTRRKNAHDAQHAVLEQSQITIQGLIDLVRVQSTIISAGEVHSLRTLLKDVVASCTQQINTKHDMGDMPIEGNPLLLKRALLEIFKNAAEHPKEGATLTTWFCVTEQKERIILDIEDNGIGVPEVYFPLLGTPLLDVHKQHNTKGVGLAIAHHVIRTHQGNITYHKSTHGGLHVRIVFQKNTP